MQTSSHNHFDIIGDVHGQLPQLTQLLEELGYQPVKHHWQHPNRQAIFVGDYLDKGTHLGETLSLIKAMVEAGAARVVVGNHELNLLRTLHKNLLDPQADDYAYELLDVLLSSRDNDYCRLAEDFAHAPEELAEILTWLQEQPIWIDEPGLKVVHACWDASALEVLRREEVYTLNTKALQACLDKGNPLYYALDLVVAGCEHTPLAQPSSKGFNTSRKRVRWWPDAVADYENFCLPIKQDLEAAEQPQEVVFFGHYSLRNREQLNPISDYQVCTDFGAAYGGPLVAYRHTRHQPACSRRFYGV